MRWLVTALCSAVFGGLAALQGGTDMARVAAWAVAGAVYICGGLMGLTVVLYVFNFRVGFRAVWAAVGREALLLLPFALLALFANLMLHWNAVQAFASAGLMTTGGAVGVELTKIADRKRMVNVILPGLGASALAALWLLVGAAALK